MILAELILLLFLLCVIIILSYSLLRGAPFAPLGENRIRTMFELLELKQGKKLLDLGSGDGRIVLAASKHGINSVGYEINPLLVLVSKIKKANVKMKDFWREDFSDFDYVTLYGTSHIMRSLERKLRKELKPGARVVSNHFKFPGWKEKRMKDDVWLYEKS